MPSAGESTRFDRVDIRRLLCLPHPRDPIAATIRFCRPRTTFSGLNHATSPAGRTRPGRGVPARFARPPGLTASGKVRLGAVSPPAPEFQSIGIIGLGYVGLPLAVAFAEAGRQVIGLDTDSEKVDSLNRSVSYIEDVPSASLEVVGERIRATSDFGELASCEAVIICVPTPLTGSREPDLSYLTSAARNLAEVLEPGQLVVLESTTYPGTTRDLLAGELEARGREVGRDFHLAFSPERIDPGRTDFTVRTTPKLVGGMTPDCTNRAAELYEIICDRVIRLSGPEAAELSKLLENIFRSVNIALVNELAQLCHRLGVDVWEVVDAASTKPFGFMRFEPGPGMGGHCLPVDPFYLAFKAREHDFYPEFIELAGKINQSQPLFCVSRVERVLNDNGRPVNGSRILILGVSYKAGVGDIRESPALKIIRLLAELGGDLSYHDPHVPELEEAGLTNTSDLDAALGEADLTVIVTSHPEVDLDQVVAGSKLVLDLRGVTREIEAAHVTRL
ncbi:MAG: nucleotide sugar dehydrogenase [Thermoleophilia bacterium]|nr:nucleotide sugar dehydrogenase [Thermoleophilia bacterium]